MNLKITGEKENPVLERTEIEFAIDATTTPKRETVQQEIAKSKGTKNELVVIRKIRQEFGKHESKGTAMLYKNEKQLKLLERSYMLERGKKKEKKEGETKAPEKPKEEKKEKAEEKK